MTQSNNFEFYSGVPISYGKGRAADVSSLIDEEGATTPLIVTDENLRTAGVLDPILNSLEQSGLDYHLFTEVEPNPKAEIIEHGTEIAQDKGIDCVVAVGGGSSIDTGKGIALLTSNPGGINRYWRNDDGSYVSLKAEPLPLLAVPTTVGTGSEVTGGLVVTDTENDRKVLVGGKGFYPDHALLDPTLLRTLPSHVTAATGMDSFTQAIESYIAVGSNPFTEALAIHAIDLISENLRPAVGGTSVDALGQMQIATTLGGMALTNSGLGLVHGISHPISARYDTPHGITNAVLLPYVLEFNLISASEKYADMAQIMGRSTEGLSTRQAASEFVEAVVQLNKDLDIPKNLRDLDVEENSLRAIAEAAVDSGDPNPRDYSVEDVQSILERAY